SESRPLIERDILPAICDQRERLTGVSGSLDNMTHQRGAKPLSLDRGIDADRGQVAPCGSWIAYSADCLLLNRPDAREQVPPPGHQSREPKGVLLVSCQNWFRLERGVGNPAGLAGCGLNDPGLSELEGVPKIGDEDLGAELQRVIRCIDK